MKFSAIIPTNCISVMTDGSIRLKIDIDKQYANIIPELMRMSGGQIGVFLVDETEAKKIMEKKKSIEQKLLEKCHILWGIIARWRGITLEQCKKKYKEDHNIMVSTSKLDRDSLLSIIHDLETTCDICGFPYRKLQEGS